MTKIVKTQPSLKDSAGKERVFLDYASITPQSSEVSREILRAGKFWANPSSLHGEGREAKNILEESRTKIARVLHCRASEIFFTAGGTEALNLAILGVIRAAKPKSDFEMPRPQKSDLGFALPHVITSTIEHTAVLEPIKQLAKIGEIEASLVLPNEKGIISPESIKREFKENTVLVAIQHANNEIGTIQPIREISKILKNFRDESRIKNQESSKKNSDSKTHDSYFIIHNSFPYFLIDASQSVCYEDVSLERLGADMLVLDGMKMYGPRSAGILAVKRGVQIAPVIFGGGQEGGIRPGTPNVPAAAGLAEALEIAAKMREKESARLKKLRDYAIAKILKEIPNSKLNGSLENRLPNNINICFLPNYTTQKKSKGILDTSKVDSEFLVIKLDTLGFAVSAASACHTLALENSSYVIESVSGKSCASSSLRVTLGRSTKKSDLDFLIAALRKIIK